ncbi:VOC family protein [Paenibacillus sambharensis]|uniref:VOC family protein n=1 Tax=Paenibacillus sambharensis TaxID=1803190 RepID=UPI0015E8E431|nr:VOC family protein [Paenibacillus sambharensis]
MQFINEVVQIYLPSSNIRRSVEWYVDVFGYRVIWEQEDSANLKLSQGPLLFLRKSVGSQSIFFIADNEKTPVISFKTSNFEAFYNSLRMKGLSVTEINEYGTGENGPYRDFSTKDPDGNLIEVNEFPDIKLPHF